MGSQWWIVVQVLKVWEALCKRKVIKELLIFEEQLEMLRSSQKRHGSVRGVKRASLASRTECCKIN